MASTGKKNLQVKAVYSRFSEKLALWKRLMTPKKTQGQIMNFWLERLEPYIDSELLKMKFELETAINDNRFHTDSEKVALRKKFGLEQFEAIQPTPPQALENRFFTYKEMMDFGMLCEGSSPNNHEKRTALLSSYLELGF